MTMPSSNNRESSKLWDSCLQYISLRVKQHSFNTWFKHTEAYRENGSLKIQVANQFVADWLNGHYGSLISEAISEVNGNSLDFEFQSEQDDSGDPQTEIEFRAVPDSLPEPVIEQEGDSIAENLNRRYSFDNMVVGDFNQFAHAAAKAVAESPGTTNYNPLFIYGGTGLGKTHLAQAIGRYVTSNLKCKRVMYASSEKFTSDFIRSLSDGTISSFASKYRSVDVLLIDDIQFFSGKESTQEQFFHTFNDLYHAGKQIVLTSDRHPKDTKGLEERLLSRFASGLIADLQIPDLETRVAILRHKTEREKAEIPEDVLYFIADHVNSNIRELEGCLTRLMAFASLEKAEIDLEFAHRVLGREIIKKRKELTISMIQKETSGVFHIDQELLISRKKTSQIVLARQVAMYLSRKHTDFSLKSIGEAFGGRDHSTVIHACDLIEKRLGEDISIRDKVETISSKLLN